MYRIGLPSRQGPERYRPISEWQIIENGKPMFPPPWSVPGPIGKGK
jgi:hypothetical protein